MIFSLNHHLESDLAQQIMPEKFPKEPLRKKESADKAKTKNNKKRFRLPRIPTLEDANVLDLFEPNNNNTDSSKNSSCTYNLEDTFNINHVDDAFRFLSQTEEFLKSISQRAKHFADTSIQEEQNNEIVENKDLAQQEFDSLVMDSVTDNESIASETLAQLLAKQGQMPKAIKMYKKLAQQQPHKMAYFEQKIEELKTKK